ncbi:10140_t:CDS:2 [Entrophospora sp. SA101]|nr:10140_t:CDS:2 [Entrophospora sp. SA101]
MGALLSNLLRGSSDVTIPDLNIDFENPIAKEEERSLHIKISRLLQPTDTLLDSIRQYQGCGELIKKAISNPTPDNEEEAWQAVKPAVAKLKRYFEFSALLENAFPELFTVLCEGNMRTPSIQNDFSYYRRTLSRGKLAIETDLKTDMIEDELANKISLFYAYPTPMLKMVTDVTAHLMTKDNLGKGILECLSGLAAACYQTVTRKRYQNPETTSFCLRVMVVCIILYDHIDPQGAFNKQSPINIKSSVKAIQTHGTSESSNLMSALRFNTKHLNDDSTPKNIKQLLSSH